MKALHDVRRGSHSIGAHVRDAAAYVCWAFARAYTPILMKEHFQTLAPALLTVACYDREVCYIMTKVELCNTPKFFFNENVRDVLGSFSMPNNKDYRFMPTVVIIINSLYHR